MNIRSLIEVKAVSKTYRRGLQNVALPMIAAGNLDLCRADDLLRSVGLGDRTLHRATELRGSPVGPPRFFGTLKRLAAVLCSLRSQLVERRAKAFGQGQRW